MTMFRGAGGAYGFPGVAIGDEEPRINLSSRRTCCGITALIPFLFLLRILRAFVVNF
jgi:hypothetical protein